MSVVVTLENHWGELARKLPQAVENAVEMRTDAAFAMSQRLVPVDTSELKDSGVVESGENRYTRYIVYRTDHAWYPEFGTRYMGAQPYLIPSIEAQRQPFKDMFESLVGLAMGGMKNGL